MTISSQARVPVYTEHQIWRRCGFPSRKQTGSAVQWQPNLSTPSDPSITVEHSGVIVDHLGMYDLQRARTRDRDHQRTRGGNANSNPADRQLDELILLGKPGYFPSGAHFENTYLALFTPRSKGKDAYVFAGWVRLAFAEFHAPSESAASSRDADSDDEDMDEEDRETDSEEEIDEDNLDLDCVELRNGRSLRPEWREAIYRRHWALVIVESDVQDEPWGNPMERWK